MYHGLNGGTLTDTFEIYSRVSYTVDSKVNKGKKVVAKTISEELRQLNSLFVQRLTREFLRDFTQNFYYGSNSNVWSDKGNINVRKTFASKGSTLFLDFV